VTGGVLRGIIWTVPIVGAVLVFGPGSFLAEADASGATASQPVIRMDPEISWSPAAPGEGRLFTLRVVASRHTPLIGVHGAVAGEELHFGRPEAGTFESIAAVPVDADTVVEAELRVLFESGGEKKLTARIPVTRGEYRHERLTVAPRFGAPPDSADQVQLERDRARAASVSAAAHRTPRLWNERVVLPRSSRVTSGFGDGRVFNGQVSSRHLGLDLQGVQGDTVLAAARGVVQVVEPFLLAGNVVYLNHGAGVVSGYFHLSEPLVSPGDTVEAGEPVGRVGATGRVTGPHLHWVVRYGSTSVDPRSLLEVSRAPAERPETSEGSCCVVRGDTLQTARPDVTQSGR
jgi:murein DD-endopeptidase MepM/ murein hydrolase activator NlpD